MADRFTISAQEANTAAGIQALRFESGAVTRAATAGRSSTPALSPSATSRCFAFDAAGVTVPLLVVLRGKVGQHTAGFTHSPIFSLYVGTTLALTFGWHSSGVFYINGDLVDGAGTLLTAENGGTTSNIAAQRMLEVKVTPHATTGGSVEVRVDRTVVASATGVKTYYGTGTPRYTAIGFGSATGFYGVRDFQDVLVRDTSGSVNNGYPGDVQVNARTVTADGVVMGATAVGAATAAECVDDAASDGDTTYAQLAAAGKMLFAFSDMADPTQPVYSVELIGLLRKDDAGPNDGRLVLRNGAAEAVGSTVALSTTYSPYGLVIQADPDGGAPMSGAEWNTMQGGWERTA